MINLTDAYGNQVNKLLSSCNLMTEDIDFSKHQVLGEFENNDLIAIAVLEVYGSFALLRSVAVTPLLKNKGVGSHIVKQAEGHAKKLNVQQLYLLTETANIFFNKLGYEQIDRSSVPKEILKTKQFAELCPQSAVCMTKKLNDE